MQAHSVEFMIVVVTLLCTSLLFLNEMDLAGEAARVSRVSVSEDLPVESPPVLTVVTHESFDSVPVETSYVYGSGLIKSESFDGDTFYEQDYLGSNRVVIHEGVVKILDYLAFGEPLTSSDSKFSFTGKEEDLSGLQYFGARYYDANLGRFTQFDPLGDGYYYANNNPLLFIDPDGMKIRLPNNEETRQDFLGYFSAMLGAPVSAEQTDEGEFLVLPKNYKGEYTKTYGFLGQLVSHKDTVYVDDFPKLTVEISRLGSDEVTLKEDVGQIFDSFFEKSIVSYGYSELTIDVKGRTLYTLPLRPIKNYIYTEHGDHQISISGFVSHFDELQGQMHPYLILAHELGHALATMNQQPNDDIGGTLRSPESLGPGVYWENVVRKEAGFPIRARYTKDAISSQKFNFR